VSYATIELATERSAGMVALEADRDRGLRLIRAYLAVDKGPDIARALAALRQYAAEHATCNDVVKEGDGQ
jgi:hypothetical protein